jgi:hypothetical protein
MPKGALPGYVFDERMRGGRYRVQNPDGSLGRLVSQKSIAADVRSLHEASAARFAGLARAAQAGDILPADFQRAMMSELKDLHNATAALAHGGWSGMDSAAWGRNGQILRDEYKFLAGFAQDLADGKLTAAQADARARLYVDGAYARYWAEDLRVKAGQYAEERFVTVGDDRVCRICRGEERRGWGPIGSRALPGDLHAGCRCEKDYR